VEHRPYWETNDLSTSPEIPRLLRNPHVHYRVHNSPPVDPILRQMNPVHNFPSSFPKIHYNIIFPSTSRFSEWPLSFRFTNQTTVCISHLSHACYIFHPSHFLCLYHRNNILWSVDVLKLIMQCSPASHQSKGPLEFNAI